jgi:hypothetical protein
LKCSRIGLRDDGAEAFDDCALLGLSSARQKEHAFVATRQDEVCAQYSTRDPKEPAGELALTSDLTSSISVRWHRAF